MQSDRCPILTPSSPPSMPISRMFSIFGSFRVTGRIGSLTQSTSLIATGPRSGTVGAVGAGVGVGKGVGVGDAAAVAVSGLVVSAVLVLVHEAVGRIRRAVRRKEITLTENILRIMYNAFLI